jgi:hypothetical protein
MYRRGQTFDQVQCWRDELLSKLYEADRETFPVVVLANKVDMLEAPPAPAPAPVPATDPATSGPAAEEEESPPMPFVIRRVSAAVADAYRAG